MYEKKQYKVPTSRTFSSAKNEDRQQFQMKDCKRNHVMQTIMTQLKPIVSGNRYRDDEIKFMFFDKEPECYKIVFGPLAGTRLIYDSEEDVYFDLNYKYFDLQRAIHQAPSPSRKERYFIKGIGTGVAYPNMKTILDIFGLISCVGLVICNDNAAYATHIVILNYKKIIHDDSINKQVNALREIFFDYTKEYPSKVIIIQENIDEYKKYQWFDELIPDGCEKQYIRSNNYQHEIRINTKKESIKWRCDQIHIKENNSLISTGIKKQRSPLILSDQKFDDYAYHNSQFAQQYHIQLGVNKQKQPFSIHSRK